MTEKSALLGGPERDNADSAEGAAPLRRKPYAEPQLVRYDRLPVITAGSLSESEWGF